MSKLIITEMSNKGTEFLFHGFHNGKRFYQVGFEKTEENADVSVGDIYIGRVKDVVKNINAAFIEYKKGKTGYFSLIENKRTLFLNHKTTDKICQGDLVLVQIAKEAVKTKDPVLTSDISLSGKYIVLNASKNGVGFSSKIRDNDYKEVTKKFFSEELELIQEKYKENFGVIVRTNAKEVSYAEIKEELYSLLGQYHNMLKDAECRTCFSVMHKEDYNYLKAIKGAYNGEIEEIITDDAKIYENICDYLRKNDLSLYFESVRLYKDDLLALNKLYSVEILIKDILDKRVWLKSGAYLVVEPTEAMTVIDVNTGKCIKGKNLRQTVLNVNLEAAEEIAYQIRVRNLSGIIMIDFINMEFEEDKKKLLYVLNGYLSKDKIKTAVIDITKLDIVEVTRKKLEPPVWEQIK